MILYITARDHTNFLDFLQDIYIIEKQEGLFYLDKWRNDTRNFSHITELILDREAFYETDDEFVEVIKSLIILHKSRISILLFGKKAEEPIVKDLLALGITNLVTETGLDEAREEIQDCLSPDGLCKFDGGNSKRRYRFKRNIKIGVFGSQTRMGVTNTALGLARWISDVGGSAIYVEEHLNGHAMLLGKTMGISANEKGFTWNEVQIHPKVRNAPFPQTEYDNNFNVAVHDFGSSLNGIEHAMSHMDISLFIVGGKSYELPDTINYLKTIVKSCENAVLFVNFIDKKNYDSYEELLSRVFDGRMAFLNYMPDPEYPENNNRVFGKLIREFTY